MCELFGVCGQHRLYLNEYLRTFYGHCDKHPHGWGLAIMNGNDAVIEKESKKASKSDVLKERLRHTMKEKTVLAHIRYATIGNVELWNCHPYTAIDESGRRWTMIHNGTIFEYEGLDKYSRIQSGDTDSERILLYIIDCINRAAETKGRALNPLERFRVLDGIFPDLAVGNKLNILLYDGEQMYVHTNCRKTLYYLHKDEAYFFATVPLDDDDWQPVPFTQLLGYRDGMHVYEGQIHGNEYVDDPENYKYLYQIFADL